jgi:hypothetical protein
MAIMIGALTLPSTLPAQAEAPWVGTWKLDLAKSTYNPGPPPFKSETSEIEPWENGLKITYDMVGPRGQTAHLEWIGKFDGKDYAVEGFDYVVTNAFHRVGDRTYEAVVKVDGEVASTATIAISADGKTMTTVTTGSDGQGREVGSTTVYDKQ